VGSSRSLGNRTGSWDDPLGALRAKSEERNTDCATGNKERLIEAIVALCAASVAQDVACYKAIEKASSSKVQPAQFKEIEEDALKDFSRPESYELLATSFGNTTEKVWA
jgi:hypothetical protein